MLLHPSILFLHGRGGLREVICFEDDDVVDALVVNEGWDPEIVLCVDIFIDF
jgi:hypothetical protein